MAVRLSTAAAAALLLLAGCGDSSAERVAYEDITHKVGPLQFTRITVDRATSRRELLAVLERNNPGRKVALPPIDFSRRETFLVATGPRSSTGYALRVVRVERDNGHIVVTVHERTPSLGERVRPYVTFPFRLLVIDSKDPVGLKWPGRP